MVKREGDQKEIEDDYNDEPDETVSERLVGLTEMLPESIQNMGGAVRVVFSGVKTVYSFFCNASWIIFTSSIILFAPVIFETERAKMKEAERNQKAQVLLGPGPTAKQFHI